MNRYFCPSSLNNKPTVTIFLLCSYLMQVQTKQDVYLNAALVDLEKIRTCSTIDASLYTADMDYPNECKESVMSCFINEMEVIWYESQYGNSTTFTNAVHNVQKNVYAYLENVRTHRSNQNIEASKCPKCETFGEKKCTEFLKNFEAVVKKINKEMAGRN